MPAPMGPRSPVVHHPLSYSSWPAAAPTAYSPSAPTVMAVIRSAPVAPVSYAMAMAAGTMTAEPWTDPHSNCRRNQARGMRSRCRRPPRGRTPRFPSPRLSRAREDSCARRSGGPCPPPEYGCRRGATPIVSITHAFTIWRMRSGILAAVAPEAHSDRRSEGSGEWDSSRTACAVLERTVRHSGRSPAGAPSHFTDSSSILPLALASRIIPLTFRADGSRPSRRPHSRGSSRARFLARDRDWGCDA